MELILSLLSGEASNEAVSATLEILASLQEEEK